MFELLTIVWVSKKSDQLTTQSRALDSVSIICLLHDTSHITYKVRQIGNLPTNPKEPTTKEVHYRKPRTQVLGLVLMLHGMSAKQPVCLTTMGDLPTPGSKDYLVTFRLI